jgi:predicted nucleotidyltransferase
MTMNRSLVQTKQDAVRVIKTHGRAIRSLGVKRLGLFGSLVTQKPENDLDLLVDFVPLKKTSHNFFELSVLLEQILGRRIELVTRQSLSPILGPYILIEVEDVQI